MNPPSIRTVGAERVTLPTSWRKVWLEIPARSVMLTAPWAVTAMPPPCSVTSPLWITALLLRSRLPTSRVMLPAGAGSPGHRRARAGGEDAGPARLDARPGDQSGPRHRSPYVAAPQGAARVVASNGTAPHHIQGPGSDREVAGPPDVRRLRGNRPAVADRQVRAESESPPPSPAKTVLLATWLGFPTRVPAGDGDRVGRDRDVAPRPREAEFTLRQRRPQRASPIPPVAVTVRLPPPVPRSALSPKMLRVLTAAPSVISRAPPIPSVGRPTVIRMSPPCPPPNRVTVPSCVTVPSEGSLPVTRRLSAVTSTSPPRPAPQVAVVTVELPEISTSGAASRTSPPRPPANVSVRRSTSW